VWCVAIPGLRECESGECGVCEDGERGEEKW